MEALAPAIDAVRSLAPGKSPFELVLGIAVAFGVLYMEMGQNAGNRRQQTSSRTLEGLFARCKNFFQHYAPEVTGLTAFILLAVTLRIRGSVSLASLTSGDDKVDPIALEALAEVARQWPILMTADSLLSLQAMFRVLVLVSSVARLGGGPSLLTQEVAAISFGALVGRVALLLRGNVYMLDGPLGGYLPAACELLAMALLYRLCRGIHRRALMTSLLTLCAAAWVASRNRLNLADDKVADSLFIFAHVMELIAAFAYLCRALHLDVEAEGAAKGNVALRFAHIIMPVQACFSAYYFVQAFDVIPQLVGVGHPFEILQWGCIAQVGAYCGSALLHWAESLEMPTQELVRNQNEAHRARSVSTVSSQSRGSVSHMPQHAAVRAAPAVL